MVLWTVSPLRSHFSVLVWKGWKPCICWLFCACTKYWWEHSTHSPYLGSDPKYFGAATKQFYGVLSSFQMIECLSFFEILKYNIANFQPYSFWLGYHTNNLFSLSKMLQQFYFSPPVWCFVVFQRWRVSLPRRAKNIFPPLKRTYVSYLFTLWSRAFTSWTPLVCVVSGLNPLSFDPATNNDPLQFNGSSGPLLTECPALETSTENAKKRKRATLPPGTDSNTSSLCLQPWLI